MQPKAARTFEASAIPFAAALLAALAGVGSALPARADDPANGRKVIVRPGMAQPSAKAAPHAKIAPPAKIASPASRCALYGEGFVPVVGSDACVKIGGRLRIDLGGSGAAPVYAGSRDGINPAAHLRVGP